MPFYFVQLSNHGKKEEIQDDSDWAAIREAQAQALHLNHTGTVSYTHLDVYKRQSDSNVTNILPFAFSTSKQVTL